MKTQPIQQNLLELSVKIVPFDMNVFVYLYWLERHRKSIQQF